MLTYLFLLVMMYYVVYGKSPSGTMAEDAPILDPEIFY
jgi:hypothetical protein